MSVVAPPPHDEPELLIPEARARQRRRRMLLAAGVAVVAAAGLSVRAAIPGRHAVGVTGSGGSQAAASQRTQPSWSRVQVVRMGTSGGVTWAINGRAMWLTTDGGRTWRASTPSHLRGIRDLSDWVQSVAFLDARHGWVVSEALDRTSDGGRMWGRTIPANPCCGGVSFVTPRDGYLSAGRSLLATSDGGATWRRVSRPPFSFAALGFVDAQRGLAITAKPSELFRTADGGRSWKAIRLPVRSDLLPSVAAFGPKLVIVGERLTPAGQLVVYTSNDTGSTWKARAMPRWWTPVIGNHDEERFSAVSPTVWFAAARRSLAVTSDAGRSWRLVKVADLPRGRTITAIGFTTPRTGWGIFSSTNRSVLMRTTDGGLHWKPAGPLERKASHR